MVTCAGDNDIWIRGSCISFLWYSILLVFKMYRIRIWFQFFLYFCNVIHFLFSEIQSFKNGLNLMGWFSYEILAEYLNIDLLCRCVFVCVFAVAGMLMRCFRVIIEVNVIWHPFHYDNPTFVVCSVITWLYYHLHRH